MRRRRWHGQLRDIPSDRLHGMALRLRKVFWAHTQSDLQDRLWDAIIAELEYRHRRPGTWSPRCYCDLCRGPFPAERLAVVVDLEEPPT